MKLLLAYATYSSGTVTASQEVEKELTEKGVSVTRIDIREVAQDELSNFDVIIFASPSWLNNGKEGQPHEFFLRFMGDMQGKTLPGKKFAIFGLGDTAYMYFCGAVDYLEAFVKDLQGELLVASLRIDGFYFDQAGNTKKLQQWADTVAAKVTSS